MPEIITSGQDDTVAKEIRDLLKSIRGDQRDIADSNERVQQQLGQINNNNNLEPGERFIE